MAKITITDKETNNVKEITGVKANLILGVVGLEVIAVTTIFGNAMWTLGKTIVKSVK